MLFWSGEQQPALVRTDEHHLFIQGVAVELRSKAKVEGVRVGHTLARNIGHCMWTCVWRVGGLFACIILLMIYLKYERPFDDYHSLSRLEPLFGMFSRNPFLFYFVTESFNILHCNSWILLLTGTTLPPTPTLSNKRHLSLLFWQQRKRPSFY